MTLYSAFRIRGWHSVLWAQDRMEWHYIPPSESVVDTLFYEHRVGCAPQTIPVITTAARHCLHNRYSDGSWNPPPLIALLVDDMDDMHDTYKIINTVHHKFRFGDISRASRRSKAEPMMPLWGKFDTHSMGTIRKNQLRTRLKYFWRTTTVMNIKCRKIMHWFPKLFSGWRL